MDNSSGIPHHQVVWRRYVWWTLSSLLVLMEQDDRTEDTMGSVLHHWLGLSGFILTLYFLGLGSTNCNYLIFDSFSFSFVVFCSFSFTPLGAALFCLTTFTSVPLCSTDLASAPISCSSFCSSVWINSLYAVLQPGRDFTWLFKGFCLFCAIFCIFAIFFNDFEHFLHIFCVQIFQAPSFASAIL